MVRFLDNNSGFAQWNANKQAAKTKGGLGRVLWWVLIFLISWWLVSIWSGPRQQGTVHDSPAPVEDVSMVPVHSIADDQIRADVQGLGIYNIQLSQFHATDAATPVTLLGGTGDRAEIGLMATGTTAPTATTIWQTDGDTMHWKNKDGVEYSRVVGMDNYVITITDTVKNKSAQDIHLAPYARIVRANADSKTAGVFTGAIAMVGNRIKENDWRDLNKQTYAYTTNTGFVGFVDQYWASIVALDGNDQTIRMKEIDATYQEARFQVDAVAGARAIPAGTEQTFVTYLYTGPRDQQALGAAAAQIPGITRTMDYGWFWFLARPMLWALNGLNAVVANYGVAIILLTLVLRLILWPLTRKSYTSMMAMQRMQPEMARIQKQFANDKPRMQMEMMRLYQTHKTSPMSGCLPMLIQIPIFFALYKALLISVQMRSAQFLWINDLAVMDPYFILPILMGATMWWQQRLQSAATGGKGGNDVAAQTQKMMRWMPLLFTIMFAWMPAGLVLYWTVSNLFGIGQMYIIKRTTK